MGNTKYPKQIRVDENAYEILLEVKEEIKKEGIILNPSFSECIRWLYKRAYLRGD